MFTSKPSRRTFLKGTALGGAALATSGVLSFEAWRAHASNAESSNQGESKITPSLCNACTSKCGLYIETRGGELYTVRGNETHPYSKGKLCARGHGFSQTAYSEDLITQPMRRLSSGEFESISWDIAYQEIAEKLNTIIDNDGPGAVGAIHDPRPSGNYYIPRFMKALGSPNTYTHNAACNGSKVGGMYQTVGSSGYSVDFDSCEMVVFIGRSYGDGIRPSSVSSIAKAAEAGTRVVIVDPRLNNTGIFADDWIAVRPGSDLALLMAVAHVLIEEDLYNHEFVETHSYGFAEFALQAKEYSPEWAEEKTDVSADKIRELAYAMAKAAPAVAVEAGWRGAFGCAYNNSYDTARAIAAINALLGSYGQVGGALLTPSLKFGTVEDSRFGSPPNPEIKRVGNEEYPLAPSSYGSNIGALEAALDGRLKGLLFYNSNAAKGYAQPKVWNEALEKLELSVVIDIQMSETAMQADYVLPECTYIERSEVAECMGGKKQYVTLRSQAIERIHPETKSCDEIITELANACGVGQYFDFTLEELNRTNVETLGLTYEDMCEKGVIEVTQTPFEYGIPAFKTETEKFQFVSDETAQANMNPVIGYVAPLTAPQGDELFLIGGKQSIHSHTMTLNNPALNEISRTYNMERVWLNASDAEARGIKDNDMVEISSSEHTGQVRARVTQRLKPGVLYIPTHYGSTSPYQTKAYQYGVSFMEFVPFHGGEPGVGSAMAQEAVVTVKKVGE